MQVKKLTIKQDSTGKAVLNITLDCPPSEYSDLANKINDGVKYDMLLKPIREGKSSDQLGAIWGKIGEIADALTASKEEIYEECLRRYGQSIYARIAVEALPQLQTSYRLVDVKQERDDGTLFVVCYKGLSEMSTAEASKLLDGILSECKEMGLSSEVRND